MSFQNAILTSMQIKRKADIFMPRILFFTLIYFQIAFCDASSILGLCCSSGVIDPILKQQWTEVLLILDRYWNISRGASSGHSVGSSIKGAGSPLPWNGRVLHTSIALCILHSGGNFNGKEGARFQACLPLCHLLTSEVAPLNHVVSITL